MAWKPPKPCCGVKVKKHNVTKAHVKKVTIKGQDATAGKASARSRRLSAAATKVAKAKAHGTPCNCSNIGKSGATNQ